MEHPANPHDFDDETFWRAVTRHAGRLGRAAVEQILTLYHCMIDADTPRAAKLKIAGALVYLGVPVDVIPDFVPVAGFMDDLAAIALAVLAVVHSIKPEHAEAAKKQVAKLFGSR